MMRISAVLCTRDGAAHVGEQLRSILDQDRPVDEVVVCDDASTDPTLEVVADVAAGSSVVSVVTRPEPLGIVGNFADAIRRATGDVVVLADQDDVWERHRVTVLERTFASDVVAVCSDATLIDSAGRATGRSLWTAHGLHRRDRDRLLQGRVLDQLLRWSCVTGATLAVRRRVIEAASPFPRSCLHDEWLALVAAATGRVVALPEPLLRYRVHAAAAVGVPPRNPIQLVRRRLGDPTAREREQAMLETAVARLAGRVPPEVSERLVAKADFLSRRRSPRLRSVAADLAAGRYHRFAHGLRSAALDVVAR